MNNTDYENKIEYITTIYNAAIAKMLSKDFSERKQQQLGHPINDILFRCQFNNQECLSDDFVWKFDRYYGNCFVWNSGFNSSGQRVNLKKSLLAGSTYGLQLQFYIGFNQNLTM